MSEHPTTARFSVSSTTMAFVGREREQTLLREQLTAAITGRGGLMLVGGEAGIGKTTLVAELRREAAESDFRVLTGHCYDLTMTPPFGPWRDAFRDVTGQSGQSVAPVTLVAEHETGDAPSQGLLFEQMHDLLVSMASDQPVLVVLEDLHWSDAASLELLRFLARHASAHRLLIVITYRDTELTRLHPLFQTLPLLVREAQAWRIDLRRLHANDVQALVAARYRLQADAETRLVAHLQAQAEGNPLFVSELLRTLEDEGFLALTSDGWVLRELDHVPIPPLVLQVIEGRLARLGDDTRELLQIAAVIGHIVPVDVWQAVAEVDDEQLLAVTERGVEAHLLEAAGDDASVRFVHALVREAVYGGIMPTRRRNWHRQVAEALSVQPRPGPDAVALHFRLAGDERAVDWHVEAGERALRMYAWITAADRFETAAQLLDGNESALRRRGWLLYRAGRLHRFSDPARSLALLDDVERIAGQVGDPLLAAIARFDHQLPLDHLNRKAEALAAMECGIADLLDITEEQARESGIHPVWVADVPSSPTTVARDAYAALQSRQGSYTVQLANFSRLRDAMNVGEHFLASSIVSDSRVDPTSIADALDGLATVYAEFGQPHEARRAFERAREIGRQAGHTIGLASTTMREAFYVAEPYATDDVGYRHRLASEAEMLFRHVASISPAGLSVRVAWVPVWYLEGRWDDLLREARGEPRTASPIYAARVARHQGRTRDAWALIREVYPDGPGSGRPAILLTVPYWELACALALDEGDHDLARLWLESFDQDIERSSRIWGKVESQLLWARYASLVGHAAEARQHAEAALAHASEPRQPFALIAAHRFLGQLATDAHDFAESEQHLQASLKLADACVAPFERALALLALAEVRAATSDANDARRLVEAARSICAPLQAMPTLARLDQLDKQLGQRRQTDDLPAGLSQREAEVLRLVAIGLTDAEVAERLFIARRTVNTHLTAIYTKLGVNSRVAATRFAVEHGLA